MHVALPLHFRRATSADIPVIREIRMLVTENVLSNPERVTYQMCEVESPICSQNLHPIS